METHPSNHYRYCPRCSSQGLFNLHEMSFYCSSCGFHFFMNSAAAVTALIFNTEGKLLVTRRGVEPDIGKLDLPGGFVDPNEGIEQALLRELKEELDLVPDEFTYFTSFPNEYLFSGTIVHTVDMIFKCKVNNFDSLKYRDDITGVEFILPQMIDLNDFPFKSVKNVLKLIKNE
jgi:NAD+ diphosphatase